MDHARSRRRRAPQRLPDGLGRRGARVLRGVVNGHLRTGGPVGSTAAIRHGNLDISAATVRAVMVDLTAAGLLAQPHASAGRIPTAQGWRLYVDHLMRRRSPRADERDALTGALADQLEPEGLLRVTSRLLAAHCNEAVVGRRPRLDDAPIDRLELMPLDGGRAVAVLVLGGVVRHQLVSVEGADAAALQRAQNLFNDRFAGAPLSRVRATIRAQLETDGPERPLLRLASRALPEDPSAEEALIVEGSTHVLARPGAEAGVAETLHALADRTRLLDVLDALDTEEGAVITFGAELSVPALRDCTVVAAAYGIDGQRLGTLAIVAPVRMDYARIVPWVTYAAGALSAKLAA